MTRTSSWCSVLAGQATAALTNARLYRAIQEQAITDGLTGLFNHRYFYERLAQEFARAQRYGLPLSLLMLDIDDFKTFNDTHGHPAGDLVLREVGRLLSTQLRRDVDVAARYGGEEFAVLLPNTARDGAQVVGDRIVREVAALDGPASVPPAARAMPRARSASASGWRSPRSTSVRAPTSARVTVSVGGRVPSGRRRPRRARARWPTRRCISPSAWARTASRCSVTSRRLDPYQHRPRGRRDRSPASLDLEEVLATIARQVGEALDVQYCDIHEYDAASDTMTCAAEWTPLPDPDEESYVGTVIPIERA